MNRGKGRVIGRAGTTGIIAGGTAQVQCRNKEDEDATTAAHVLPRRYPAWLEEGMIPLLDLGAQPQRAPHQMDELMWRGRPVHLRGTGWLQQPLLGATATQLVELLDGWTGPLPVWCSEARHSRFFEWDAEANVFGSHYHVREPETRKLHLSFRDLAAAVDSWTQHRLFLRAPLCTVDVPPVMSSSQGGIPQFTCSSLAGMKSCEAVQRSFAWQALSPVLASQRWTRCNLELEWGAQDGLLPARYSTTDRLMLQVSGQRRVLLLSPQHALPGLYPYPFHHAYDRYSMVNFDSMDQQLWSQFSKMLEAPSTTLVANLQSPARRFMPDAALLQVSRVVEKWVGQEYGAANVRQRLLDLAHGRERQLFDPLSTAGYRGWELGQAVREQVAACLEAMGELGHGWSVPRAVEAMCQGRLMPTDWLNENFRDPLMLKDLPRRLIDDRSDEERLFPELFRHTLRERGEGLRQDPVPALTGPSIPRLLLKC